MSEFEYKNIDAVYLMNTNRCNMRCKYCYESDREGDMPIEIGLAAVDWLHSQGNRERPTHITFFGGEPLLRPDLIREVVRHTYDNKKQKGFYTILTNGTIYNDEIEELLQFVIKRSRKFMVQISLDGDKESHDKNRVFINGEPTFDVVIKNVAKFKKLVPDMIFRQTVTPENVHDLSKDFKMMYDICGKHGNVSQTLMTEGDWTPESNRIYKEETAKVIEIYKNTDNDSNINILHGTLRKLMDTRARLARGCSAGRTLACVDTDGSIYPCHRFAAYRNIYNMKIGDVWKGIDVRDKNYQLARQSFGQSEACNKCKVTNCNMCLATNLIKGRGLKFQYDEKYCGINLSTNDMLEKAAYDLVKINRIILNFGKILFNKNKIGGFINMDTENKKNTEFVDNEDLYAQAFMGILKMLKTMDSDIKVIRKKLDIEGPSTIVDDNNKEC